MKKGYNIDHFRAEFPNEDACLNRVFELVHGNGKCCPKCSKKVVFRRVKTRPSFQCPKCYHQIYPCAGTIFHKSTTPLTYWFYAMFLFTVSKNGFSAAELMRHIPVTEKTALRMLRQIRSMIKEDRTQLDGYVELDETFIGGKNKNRHRDKKIEGSQGRSFKDKTPVFGMLQRGGKVYAYVVANTKKESLMPIAMSKIAKGSTVYTDEWEAYNPMDKDYNREFVYHSRGEYANGDCTTNRIENFWSVLKRTLNGSYIRVSPKYLQLYVNEVAFRYNNRNNKYIFKELLTFLC